MTAASWRSRTFSGSRSEKLAAGDLVLYPGTSVHRVMPVTRGARLASFFWIQSMVRDNEQRAMLYELDAIIQRLGGAAAPSMTRRCGWRASITICCASGRTAEAALFINAAENTTGTIRSSVSPG